MEKIDIVIDMIEKLDVKVDALGTEFNKSVINQSVNNTKTERNEEDIKEIKQKIIDEKIAASRAKMKNWFYAGASAIFLSIIGTIINFLK